MVLISTEILALPQLDPQPDWTQVKVPGKVELDAWGWHGALFYQHTYQSGVDYDYFRKNVVQESYRWGSNLLEIFLTPNGYPWEWTPSDNIPREEGYVFNDDPKWKNESLKNLNRLAHEHNMLIQWFCHPELVVDSRMEPKFEDAAKIEHNLNAVKAMNNIFADATNDGWMNLLDGYGHEHWFVDKNGRTSHAQWLYNPSQYCYSTYIPTWHPVNEPGYAQGYMNAASWALRGRDDQWGMTKEHGGTIIGARPMGYQADSRTYKAPSEVWGGLARYGGGTYPDWVLKQTNDFARRRLYAKGKPDASAIWWLGETPPVLPKEYRPYVYGSCMNPLKTAVAAPARTTGKEGFIELMSIVEQSNIGPARFECPASGYFVQNNIIRMEIDPDRGYRRLLYDPSRTGHFDNNSDAVILADPFFELSFDGIIGNRKNMDSWKTVASMRGYEQSKFIVSDRFIELSDSEFPSILAKVSPKAKIIPRRLHFKGFLDFGQYSLKLKTADNIQKTFVRIRLNDRFIGAFPALGESTDYQVPFSVPRSGYYDIVVEAAEGGKDAVCKLTSLELLKSTSPVQQASVMRVVEQAGHQCALEETVYIKSSLDNKSATMKIRYQLDSDTPYLIISQECTSGDSGFELEQFCNFNNYNIKSGSKSSAENKVYVSTDNSKPAVAVSPLSNSSIGSLGAKDAHLVNLISSSAGTKKQIIAVTVLEGLYSEDNIDKLTYWLKARDSYTQVITLGSGDQPYSLRCSPKSSLPNVQVVRIKDPDGRPYYVKERGVDNKYRWYFRGAQVSSEVSDTDLLRLYFRQSDEVQIIRDGFINNLARAGWGSQYAIALSDINAIDNGARLDIDVLSATPFLFATRVQFVKSVGSVKVNGKDWDYYDDDIVFLPQKKGVYHLEVTWKDVNQYFPHLTRTIASVVNCDWDEKNRSLSIELDDPVWLTGPKIEGPWYAITINRAGWDIIEVKGAELIRTGSRAVNLKVTDKKINIEFNLVQ